MTVYRKPHLLKTIISILKTIKNIINSIHRRKMGSYIGMTKQKIQETVTEHKIAT